MKAEVKGFYNIPPQAEEFVRRAASQGKTQTEIYAFLKSKFPEDDWVNQFKPKEEKKESTGLIAEVLYPMAMGVATSLIPQARVARGLSWIASKIPSLAKYIPNIAQLSPEAYTALMSYLGYQGTRTGMQLNRGETGKEMALDAITNAAFMGLPIAGAYFGGKALSSLSRSGKNITSVPGANQPSANLLGEITGAGAGGMGAQTLSSILNEGRLPTKEELGIAGVLAGTAQIPSSIGKKIIYPKSPEHAYLETNVAGFPADISHAMINEPSPTILGLKPTGQVMETLSKIETPVEQELLKLTTLDMPADGIRPPGKYPMVSQAKSRGQMFSQDLSEKLAAYEAGSQLEAQMEKLKSKIPELNLPRQTEESLLKELSAISDPYVFGKKIREILFGPSGEITKEQKFWSSKWGKFFDKIEQFKDLDIPSISMESQNKLADVVNSIRTDFGNEPVPLSNILKEIEEATSTETGISVYHALKIAKKLNEVLRNAPGFSKTSAVASRLKGTILDVLETEGSINPSLSELIGPNSEYSALIEGSKPFYQTRQLAQRLIQPHRLDTDIGKTILGQPPYQELKKIAQRYNIPIEEEINTASLQGIRDPAKFIKLITEPVSKDPGMIQKVRLAWQQAKTLSPESQKVIEARLLKNFFDEAFPGGMIDVQKFENATLKYANNLINSKTGIDFLMDGADIANKLKDKDEVVRLVNNILKSGSFSQSPQAFALRVAQDTQAWTPTVIRNTLAAFDTISPELSSRFVHTLLGGLFYNPHGNFDLVGGVSKYRQLMRTEGIRDALLSKIPRDRMEKLDQIIKSLTPFAETVESLNWTPAQVDTAIRKKMSLFSGGKALATNFMRALSDASNFIGVGSALMYPISGATATMVGVGSALSPYLLGKVLLSNDLRFFNALTSLLNSAINPTLQELNK